MVELKITDKGVYYDLKYVPYRKWEWESYKEHVDLSKFILDYKDGNKFANKFFTQLLEDAIVYLSNKVFAGNVEEIALVAVPPSEVGKYSPIRESINHIMKRYDDGKITEFEYLKKLHNCSDLLTRVKDVPSSKNDKSSRIYIQHYNSIRVDDEQISKLGNVAYVILDDITTTAFTMNLCEDILIDYYVDEYDIYKLAIAETV